MAPHWVMSWAYKRPCACVRPTMAGCGAVIIFLCYSYILDLLDYFLNKLRTQCVLNYFRGTVFNWRTIKSEFDKLILKKSTKSQEKLG